MGNRKKIEELKSIVGEDDVLDSLPAMLTYMRDATPLKGATPIAVVRPSSTEEVQEIVRWANKTKTPLYPRGGGTSLWGSIPVKEGSVIVDLSKMNRVIEINENTLSCIVEPGITFSELEAVLNNRGFRFLMAPENGISGTVGGNFVTHGTGWGAGPYFSNMGDCVIGCKVVLPTAEIITTGSMANPGAHGYFYRYALANDLTGLFCGSEGTLGIIVEIALKIEELPGAMGFATFGYKNIEDAGRVIYAVRRSRIPTIYTYLSPGWTLDKLFPEKAPWPHTIKFVLEANTQEELDIEMGRLMKIAGERGTYLGPDLSRDTWNERYRWVGLFGYKLGMRVILPMHIPIGEIGQYYKALEKLAGDVKENFGLNVGAGGFLCDRSLVMIVVTYFDPSNAAEVEKALKAWNMLKTSLLEMGACPYRMGTLWADQMHRFGEYYTLLKKIKSIVDPNGIMAPGILGL
ncbi:MAG: FAD-binding oxidoreductase [Candidatus Bathyarchaeia archaeon]